MNQKPPQYKCFKFSCVRAIGDGEYIQQRKDGAEVYIQTSTTLFKDENGVPIGIITVNRDITKQKQADVALRNSEQMLINVIENIPVRVFWKDHNSVYQGCNSLHARAIGLASRVQIIGKRNSRSR